MVARNLLRRFFRDERQRRQTVRLVAGGGLMDRAKLGRSRIRGGVHRRSAHDSAHKHVTGAAEYTDDIAEPAGTLHAYLGLSDRAHARDRARSTSTRCARRRASSAC